MFQLPQKPSNDIILFVLALTCIFSFGLWRYAILTLKKSKNTPNTVTYSKPIAKKSYWLLFLLKRFVIHSHLNKNNIKLAFNLLNFSFNLLAGLAFGIALVTLQMITAASFDEKLIAKKSLYVGEVINFPVVEENERYKKISFQLKVNKVLHIDTNLKKQQQQMGAIYNHELYEWRVTHPVVKVNWYLDKEAQQKLKFIPKQGQLWSMFGKLKSNHASHNFYSRDYEAWLFQKQISGRLSVSGIKVLDNNYQSLTSSSKPLTSAQSMQSLVEGSLDEFFRVDQFLLSQQLGELRSEVFKSLEADTENSAFAAIYKALLLGDKSSISSSQWTLFQQTGTIHLMAISGLHMSIMALLGFWFAKALWWLVAFRQNRVSLPVFSALLSWSFATYYLLISGGAIPTQRAWIMVTTVILFLSLKRSFQPFSALAMAALLVLIWDVKALLSAGFWLSFLAVWLIFTSLSLMKSLGKTHKTLLVQFVLSLGLMPMIAWLYYEVPIYSLVANLVAVPFVSLIGLPLLLLAQFSSVFSTFLAIELFSLSDFLWNLLFDFLIEIQSWPLAMLTIPSFNATQLILFYLGWLIFLIVTKQSLLQFYSVKLAVWLWLLVMLIYSVLSAFLIMLMKPESTLQKAEVEMTVFDVGQGQAIAFKTQNHWILYDAGAKWGSKVDAAKVAILPYFKAHGVSLTSGRIDLFMVSHSDNDHAGGVDTILNNLKIEQALSGQAQRLNEIYTRNSSLYFKQCQSGQEWNFDGVKFSVLSPQANSVNLSDNDWSCVLKVTVGKKAILVMGDLSSRAEKRLLRNTQNDSLFKADLLIAGHHGSRYSSSSKWLQAVQPNMVVFSSGYQNRFKFPSSYVLQRIENLKSETRWWNTACSGALQFTLNEGGVSLQHEARKKQARWYHHRCLTSQKGVFYQ